ncbi:adenosylmethionine--8-amino-7-oxononanoate transaminase [bacterium]|nr:adenosylmethionine--8-amino-7-oxononanoate transaminase [bacterium]
MLNPPSKDDLRTWDNEYVWHPFAPMRSYRQEEPPIIQSGDGFHLTDIEGRRYIDGFSSLWCNVHGHRVPEIDQAIRDQLDQVSHSTLLGHGQVRSIELAKQLVELAPPGLTKVFYSDSGSTAVEVALKIAFQYQRQKPGGNDRRNLFVSIDQAYHGDTVGSVSVGSIDVFHEVYGPLLFRTLRVPSPVTYRLPTGHSPVTYLRHCYDEIARVIKSHRDEIAAVVMEPLVQGAAGILVHPPGYLSYVRDITRANDLLLIADEVAVGFGRTGTMFACEHEEVSPDLLCLGKGLTGGYLPLSATLATDEIYDAFLGHPSQGRTFFHGHTFTGNALGCAAAIASLELFQKRSLLAHVEHLSQVFSKELSSFGDLPGVGEIRQRGIMMGIELVADKESRQPHPPADRVGHAVTLHARKRGLMIRPLGDVVVLMPAPAMPLDLASEVCSITRASILDWAIES